MKALLVVLLMQAAVATPEPSPVPTEPPALPLELVVPPPELVGLDIASMEKRLGQTASFTHHDAAAVSWCKYRCDELRAYGSPEKGPRLYTELRKGRVTRARWILSGDHSRPKSFPPFERAFAKKRIPEGELVWLGGFGDYDGDPAPAGWEYGVIAWPRWGRLTQAVVLWPAKKTSPAKFRMVELIETDGHIEEGALGRTPLLAGGTPKDLLALHGEPVHVIAADPALPISPCTGGLATCDGLWVYEPQCYRGEGMVCGMILAEVRGGRVMGAKWTFESEVTVWRLPLPKSIFASFPPDSAALRETASTETYDFPDGTKESRFRRLEWIEGGIEWTVDVACPAVPHGLGFRKARVDEYRVFSVFQRPVETPAPTP